MLDCSWLLFDLRATVSLVRQMWYLFKRLSTFDFVQKYVFLSLSFHKFSSQSIDFVTLSYECHFMNNVLAEGVIHQKCIEGPKVCIRNASVWRRKKVLPFISKLIGNWVGKSSATTTFLQIKTNSNWGRKGQFRFGAL